MHQTELVLSASGGKSLKQKPKQRARPELTFSPASFGVLRRAGESCNGAGGTGDAGGAGGAGAGGGGCGVVLENVIQVFTCRYRER